MTVLKTLHLGWIIYSIATSRVHNYRFANRNTLCLPKMNLFPTQMIFEIVVIIGHDATDVLNEEAHSSVKIARES